MERGIFMPVSTTEKILSEDYFDLIVPITGSDTDFEEAFFRFGAQAAVPGYGIFLTVQRICQMVIHRHQKLLRHL